MKHVLDFCGGTKDGTCVAFGHFDGIHLGHRAVIEKVCAHEGLVPVIVSADETFKPVIYTEREKEELLKETGVEIMVSVNARDYDSMTARALQCRCRKAQRKGGSSRREYLLWLR